MQDQQQNHSSSRTTEPEQRASTLPELQTKTVDFECGKHGIVPVNIWRLSGDWPQPECQLCSEEAEAAEERRRKAYAEQQREDSAKLAIQSRLKRSGIPLRFQARSFENYIPPEPTAATVLAKCRAYAEKFPEYQKRGTCIVLCGLAGTGKTHLACSIANYIIRSHGKSAVFMQVSQAIRSVKQCYSKDAKQTEQEALAWFKTPDLLILDEVGVQFGTDTERYILFEIINERYENCLPTILISNLATDGLKAYAGERVIDRMKENGGMMLVFDWKSHRSAASE